MNQETKKPAVGFVGLGVMGTPMVSHIHKGGHAVAVHDLDMDAARKLAAQLGERAAAVDTPRELAQKSDIVITMLPNGEVVKRVVFGENGLAAGFKPGSLLLDTSSSEPWLTTETATRLSEQGVVMVDAPVSGAQWGAEAAELVFMVGGRAEDLQRVRPILECMGKSIFHLGPQGSGHAMKCINNLVTAITLSATAEGLVIGKAFGLDPEAMVKVMNVSTAGSWISQTHIEKRVLSRAFDDPFKLELMLKDMNIANTLARGGQTSTPISALGQQLWQAASRDAGAGASISELVRWVEKQSGTEITRGSSAPARKKN
ncbi:MAG: NAD(P)-dependent oxidoreductase [Burkholderiaceae bacterium]